MNRKNISRPPLQKNEMYWAAISEVYNNTRQQLDEDISFLVQRIKVMTAKCALTEEEEEKKSIIKRMMHTVMYHQVRIKL